MHWARRHSFLIVLCCGFLFVAAGVWLSSGTMAPYAVTLERPHVDKPCNYLLNSDHAHFVATFNMLDGAPRERWEYSIVLRRTLYPLIAYPLMKSFGFMTGGVITSLLIQLAAFVAFVLYVRRAVGHAAAYATVVLLATYPGIYYWAGLPYAYATIVPATLAAMMIIVQIERQPTVQRVVPLALLLGVLFLSYDLLPLLGPPVLAILVFRKRFAAAVLAAIAILIPTLVNNAVLSWLYQLPFRNKNTQTYFDLLQAYAQPIDFSRWGQLLSRVPGDFARVYLFSNFLFLPVLFALLFIINRFTRRLPMLSAEKWVLATAALLFAIINLAPPTPGWQFRGHGLARIYQPVFVAMLFFVVRMCQEVWSVSHRAGVGDAKRGARGAVLLLVACTALANAAVVLGPALRIRLADRIYLAFYRHAQTEALTTNLDTFGRRPLGFCDTSITIESPLSKRDLRLQKLARARKRAKLNTQTPATQPATTQSAPATATAPSPDG